MDPLLFLQKLVDGISDPKSLGEDIEDWISNASDPTRIEGVIPCTTGDLSWRIEEGGELVGSQVLFWGRTHDELLPMVRRGNAVRPDWGSFWVSPDEPPAANVDDARMMRAVALDGPGDQ